MNMGYIKPHDQKCSLMLAGNSVEPGEGGPGVLPVRRGHTKTRMGLGRAKMLTFFYWVTSLVLVRLGMVVRAMFSRNRGAVRLFNGSIVVNNAIGWVSYGMPTFAYVCYWRDGSWRQYHNPFVTFEDGSDPGVVVHPYETTRYYMWLLKDKVALALRYATYPYWTMMVRLNKWANKMGANVCPYMEWIQAVNHTCNRQWFLFGDDRVPHSRAHAYTTRWSHLYPPREEIRAFFPEDMQTFRALNTSMWDVSDVVWVRSYSTDGMVKQGWVDRDTYNLISLYFRAIRKHPSTIGSVKTSLRSQRVCVCCDKYDCVHSTPREVTHRYTPRERVVDYVIPHPTYAMQMGKS